MLVIHPAPSPRATDALLAEKVLLDRYQELQRCLIAAVRRNNELGQLANEYALKFGNAIAYIGETRDALLERFHECFDIEDFAFGRIEHVAIDIRDWDEHTDFARLVTQCFPMLGLELQFALVTFEAGQAIFQVSRLY